MDKNKSIDGLSTRRSRKASVSTTTSTKSRKPAKPAATRPKSTTTKPKTTVTRSKVATAKPKSTRVKPSTTKPKSTRPRSAKPKSTDIITPKIPATPLTSTDDFLSPTTSFNFDEETGKLEATDLIIVSSESESKGEGNPNDTNDPSEGFLADQHPLSFSDDEPEKSKKSKKPKKAKQKMSKKRKIILGIILSVVLLLITGCVWLILWGNDIIARITGGQGNVFDLLTFMDDHYEPLKTDDNGRTNILAFGTSGYNMDGEEGNGTHDGAQLTDSIMILSLDQESGDIAMLSLPRDLKVSSTCTATAKVNEIYWCNNMDGDDEQAGAEAIMTEISDILGIEFQYFAHLNWGSLVQIVDTLGGVNVTLDEGIYDYYYTKAVFEPDVEYTIDGAQALGLARARHGTESGDFSRGASQQKILIGIKNKLQEKNLSITDFTDLAGTLGDNLRTNFNVEELKTIAHIISTNDLDHIRQVSLIDPEPLMTTASINGISYVIPAGGASYYTRIQDYVAKMFSSDPRSYEDATILILNGTDTPGVASSEQGNLEKSGFNNIDVDDAPDGEYPDKYTLYSLTDAAPGTLKLLEEHYSTTAKPAGDLPADINTNYDFILILGDVQTND